MTDQKKAARLRLILIAPRGFCAGVSRAVEIVEEAARRYGAPIYARHEIVHNRHVVEDLRARGVIFIDELAEAPEGARVIFSAHGVARSVFKEAKARDLKILDATCPLVSKVHREVARHHKEGRHVLLIGHGSHVEVAGTLGQIPKGAATLIETAAEAEALDLPSDAPLAYATQTTLSVEETAEIVRILRRRFSDLAEPHGADICYATTNRQAAVRKVAGESDLFIVIGSKTSSNSARLVETARGAGAKSAHLVEDAAAMDWAIVPPSGTVAITAGASAPERLVAEMVAAFRRRFPIDFEEISGAPERARFSLPQELRQEAR